MDAFILQVRNLETEVNGKKILKNVNLDTKKGEVHMLMGPNGAGKSTLANVLMGHPNHTIVNGEILFSGESINDLQVDERARKGLFVSFQYPEEVPGITVESFLRIAKSSITEKDYNHGTFKQFLKEKMNMLDISEDYLTRYLNTGFSGGEKKKNEIFQMTVLEPKLAVLDETDSGLDIDAIRTVTNGVKNFSNDDNGILIITHYNKVLDYITPDFVHVLVDGKIVKTGDIQLAKAIEKNGFEGFKKESQAKEVK